MKALLSHLARWLGWHAIVVIVRQDAGVRTLKLPAYLAVSVRENTDGSVGITIGHDDYGKALLADLRALMSGGQRTAGAPTPREARSPMP